MTMFSCQVYKHPPHSYTCAHWIKYYEPTPTQRAIFLKEKRNLGICVANKQLTVAYTQLHLNQCMLLLFCKMEVN